MQQLQPGANPYQLLTVQEVAQLLRVDETTVRRWIKEGLLEGVELPHRGKRLGWRIKQSTISQMMEKAINL